MSDESTRLQWSNLRYVPRLLRFIWKASPNYALLALLAALLSSIIVPAQIWIFKVIVDRVSETVVQSTAADWSYLMVPLIWMAGIWVLDIAGQGFNREIHALLGVRVAFHTEYCLLEKSTQLDMAFFETSEFFDQMHNARQTLGHAHNLPVLILGIFSSVISLTGILALLAQLHPLAVVALLATTIPQLLIKALHADRMWSNQLRHTTARRMVGYLAELLSSRDAVKEVRLFNLDRPFLSRYREFWEQRFGEERALRLGEEKWNVSFGLLAALGTGGIWAYAIMQAVLERITLGDITMVFQAANQSRRSLEEIFGRGGLLYKHALYARSLFEFFDVQRADVDGTLTIGTDLSPVPRPIEHCIEFRNVGFSYPGTEKPILREVSFTLKAGETLAVVGENGAGKTTLVKLLARYYDPTGGAILIDGVDLRKFDPDEWRRELGVIFQDFLRYDLTVRENIGYGDMDKLQDANAIAAAAQKAGCQTFIEELPQQYETMLGRRFEGGTDLSIGQWQKLALSRALLRNSQVLILDEPTAALDALAEYDLYQRFSELTKGRTTVFISHRFSTVRMADRIVVIEKGTTSEQGSHDELMAVEGQYKQMYHKQAGQYI